MPRWLGAIFITTLASTPALAKPLDLGLLWASIFGLAIKAPAKPVARTEPFVLPSLPLATIPQ